MVIQIITVRNQDIGLNYSSRNKENYIPVTVWWEAVLSTLAVREAGGGQYTRVLLLVTHRPFSPSALRSIINFPSEIRNILVWGEHFHQRGEKDFYVSSRQSAGLLCR